MRMAHYVEALHPLLSRRSSGLSMPETMSMQLQLRQAKKTLHHLQVRLVGIEGQAVLIKLLCYRAIFAGKRRT